MLLLFSHKLSEEQMREAKDVWNVEMFIYMSSELQQEWSNVSPDLESLQDVLKPIQNFIKMSGRKDDIVIIQGDFGACYNMVNFAKSLKLIPVYATTKRTASEYKNEEGQTVKKSIFEHRRFREYDK